MELERYRSENCQQLNNSRPARPKFEDWNLRHGPAGIQILPVPSKIK